MTEQLERVIEQLEVLSPELQGLHANEILARIVDGEWDARFAASGDMLLRWEKEVLEEAASQR